MNTPRIEHAGTALPAKRRRLLLVLGCMPFTYGISACMTRYLATDRLDKPTNAIFLEDERAVLPQGEILRPVHPKGLALTELSEGWRQRWYNDAAGYCTIGYGHLCYKKRCDNQTPVEFLHGISQSAGRDLLKHDMQRAQVAVQLAIRDHATRLNDLQYAALCDFVFNVGGANFRESTLLKVILDDQFDRVPSQLGRWVIANGQPFEGLRLRRKREIALFFEGQAYSKDVPRQGEDLSDLDIYHS